MSDEPLLAGVEIGGTKTVVLLARGRRIVARQRIPTGTPDATLAACSAALRSWREHGEIAALGIASFGPLGLRLGRADYGCITNTPKPGWAGTDLLGHFGGAHKVPVILDTDVAGAGLAEGLWGAARDADVHVYLTIGTGVGAGLVVGGAPVHGLVHPEAGHVRVRRVAGDHFSGICPFHGDCLEGLASGPAIAARAGRPAEQLSADDPVWSLVAAEVAELCAMLVLTVSAERVVIGGGVGAGQPQLLPMIRGRVAVLLGGYVPAASAAALEALIRAPELGIDAGPLGAIALARRAWRAAGGKLP